MTRELPDTDYRRPLWRGAAVLLFGCGGFLAWAALAPLDEAVPASAVVSLEGKRKRVEHLDGGLVEKILVRDGQRVREGEDLVILDGVQARAALSAALSQWHAVKAAEARLLAEREGLASVEFPAPLRDSDEPAAQSAMQAQNRLFASRRSALEGELRIVRESARGLQEQLRELHELDAGRENQVQLFGEQIASVRKLGAQGFVSRSHLLEQERQLAELQGRRSADLANIAVVRARLAELRMRGAQREGEYRREANAQLAEMQKEAAILAERVAAQRDVHSRLVLRAPVAGTVVDLATHTIGGVVRPGERIMDIVPAGDEVLLDARVAPLHIDRVRPGLPVDVHLDGFMGRAQRPVMSGSVAVVSADALADPKSGEPYYAVRVRVQAGRDGERAGLELVPGMPATVMVKTGERSLLVYLASPLLRRFRTALAEH